MKSYVALIHAGNNQNSCIKRGSTNVVDTILKTNQVPSIEMSSLTTPKGETRAQ